MKFGEVGQARRHEIVRFIVSFTEEHRYPPSVRQIAEAVGLSVVTTHHHLAILRDEGRVTWVPGENRTLVVRDAG